MPARSNPPSSSSNQRRRSAKPAGISFHLSSLTSAISVSRARLSWAVASHLLRSAIRKRSHHRSHASTPASAVVIDHPVGSPPPTIRPLIAIHRACFTFRIRLTGSTKRSWSHSMYVYACLEGSPESKLPARSTISSGFSSDWVTRTRVELDVKHRMMYP